MDFTVQGILSLELQFLNHIYSTLYLFSQKKKVATIVNGQEGVNLLIDGAPTADCNSRGDVY